MSIKTHYTIHEHVRKKNKQTHWDIRIIRPGKAKAWSFAIPKAKLPTKSKKVLAIKTEDHALGIMSKSGKLKNGDTLNVLESGKCEIVKYNPRHISILFKGKMAKGLYAFIYMEKDQWLMIAAK